MKKTFSYDLREVLSNLVTNEPGIVELYLFGSRAYGTGSLRSDCDIIVRADHDSQVKPSNLREFALDRCPPLDLFLCTDARAVSTANDSFVYSTSFEDLVRKLDAVLLWTRTRGFEEFSFPLADGWKFQTSREATFLPSNLPDGLVTDQQWQLKLRRTETEGFPTQPYIGDTLVSVVSQIVRIARGMIFRGDQLGQKGIAKTGWTVNLASEYDCQNLFFSVIKPWLPELGREEIAIRFDGQETIADFNLFDSRLVVEMKFIDGPGKKAEVVKTLEGLKRFYSRNANIGCLLFIIYVKEDIDLDGTRWEQEFSFSTTTPAVVTIVVRIP
jgi:predicted nucleotidyltransferase